MSEDAVLYAHGPLTPTQLTSARLRAAWEYLSDVAHDADLLPVHVRTRVLQAFAQVSEARALLAKGPSDDAP